MNITIAIVLSLTFRSDVILPIFSCYRGSGQCHDGSQQKQDTQVLPHLSSLYLSLQLLAKELANLEKCQIASATQLQQKIETADNFSK